MMKLIVSFFLIFTIYSEEEIVNLVSVIDGDTIKINHNNKKENVRMIGVDACEINENSRLYRESKKYGLDPKIHMKLGRRAKDNLIKVLNNSKKVKLVYDREKRDQYDRLLAYVYTLDGIEINKYMIENGYVRNYYVEPNTSHQSSFKEAQFKAQKNKLGIWNFINTNNYDKR